MDARPIVEKFLDLMPGFSRWDWEHIYPDFDSDITDRLLEGLDTTGGKAPNVRPTAD